MQYRIYRSLLSIVLLCVLWPVPPARADWREALGRLFFGSNQPAPALSNQPQFGTPINQLSRGGLNYMNQLGGGLDADGNYQYPFQSALAFGVTLADGRYQAQADFDPELYFVLDVSNGLIFRLQFALVKG